jgi:DNA-binding transcriptional LysR family regulator
MDLDGLDLKKLRAFHLVAKQGSLRLAAARLKQSIPAISGKLRKLEKDLGVELFERLPNKLVLTVAGERFLNKLDAVFDKAEEALASLSTGVTGARLAVSVGSDHAWYFAPKIRDFLYRYPATKLSLSVYKSADALVALDKGTIDVSIGIFPRLPKRLEREVVAESTMALAFNRKDAAVFRRGRLDLAELARQRLIVPPRLTATRSMIDRTMAAILAKAGSVIEVPTCETALTFVEMGLGAAVVHTLCCGRAHPRDVRSADLGVRFGKVAFCAVYRKETLRLPLARALLEELTSP